MSENKTFEIDFAEVNAIPDVFKQTEPTPPSKTNRLQKIWGFNAQTFGNKASGPAALGTVLHFHEIGWNHVPRHQNGRPVNDPYLAEIIRWSKSPDLLSGSLGSSPALILNSLRKAGLISTWYAGNSLSKTMALVKHELDQQRPVIVLVNQQLRDYPLLLEWQVIFKMDEHHVYTKHCASEDGTYATPENSFIEMISMEYLPLSCSVITARKE